MATGACVLDFIYQPHSINVNVWWFMDQFSPYDVFLFQYTNYIKHWKLTVFKKSDFTGYLVEKNNVILGSQENNGFFGGRGLAKI